MTGTSKAYNAAAFAVLAGVTVRTLHHYDRLGLLRARRLANGYRVYYERDLQRLQQIVALKYIGLGLAEIGRLLDNSALGFGEALRAQRRVLLQKRSMLDQAIAAIEAAEVAPSDTLLLKRIIEVMEMQTNKDWMAQYSNDAAKAKIEARKALWSPELQERVTRQWTEVIAEAERVAGQDPASEAVQAVAARWQGLIDEFTGGDLDIEDSTRRLYADRANWPEGFKQQMSPFGVSEAAGQTMRVALEVFKTRRG